MKMTEYVRRYDRLTSEAPLYDIPLRKEYLIREIGRGRRVLDLGCLGGQFSKLIKDQNNDVYGVEVNPKAAAMAESRGIRVKVFDLNDGIPFEDGFFDVVNAGEIIEYIYDTKFLFEEINRVLKPGGLLFLSTPNLNSLSNRVRVLRGGYLSQLGAYPDDHFGENIRVFNAAKIRELCAHTGFRVMDVVGVPALEAGSLSYRLLRPVVHFAPEFGALLIVKARRNDD
jgi:methionine biosynthesis protein MetW